MRHHSVIIGIVGLGLGSAVLGACGSHPNGSKVALAASITPSTAGITATGTGTADGPPDLLTIQVGVQTTGARAQQTLQTNNAEAQQVIDKLEADGVAAKDLQTSQLTLNPNYSNGGPNTPPRLTGYTAQDIVTAKIRDLARGGAIIDDAVTAGGADAQLQSVQYSVENDGALQAQARAAAVSEAFAEAKAMAAAAGVTLGPVQFITDTEAPVTVPYAANYGPTAGAAASPSMVPAPVQAGSEEISAQVTVTYGV